MEIYLYQSITQNQSIKRYSIKHKFTLHHQEISSLSIQDQSRIGKQIQHLTV